MSELKPCPFCGSKRAVRHGVISTSQVYVQCMDCGARTHKFGGSEKAIEAWNSRASEKIIPTPCTNVEEQTVKDWFQKINEELDELKRAIPWVLETKAKDAFKDEYGNLKDEWDEVPEVAEEAADTITAITSMLEAMGIGEQQRQEAQRCVNERNRERGRIGEKH